MDAGPLENMETNMGGEDDATGMETNVGGEDDATGNAGLLEDMETKKVATGNATGEEELGVSADMGDDAVDEETEIGNATEHTSSSQTPPLLVLDDDHSSPENIHEVNSLSPSSNPILDTPVGYKLPARKNRGKPPARYSPSTEGKQSQYPISNHVTTQRLTKPLRDFTDKLFFQELISEARSNQLELAQGAMLSPNASSDARVPSEDAIIELKHRSEMLSKEIDVLCKVLTA
ncbi:hypothetical protein DKX38_004750 [Salix brachista]|uniref:Uncharacterized protein n=1 Tax=Salix brachista TaxID=2182728 RepID=A0A5N5NE77_9ROSI|nr:hypothetical protein DKX38_004750 [Salix brachista]